MYAYLHLLIVGDAPVGVLDDDEGSVLLLLEQQHALEDPVQVELEALVQLIHLPLHLVADVFHLRLTRRWRR